MFEYQGLVSYLLRGVSVILKGTLQYTEYTDDFVEVKEHGNKGYITVLRLLLNCRGEGDYNPYCSVENHDNIALAAV